MKLRSILFFLTITLGLLSCGQFTIAAESSPSIRYVVIHKPGPAWQADLDFQNQPGVGAHVAHYKKLFDQGRLAFGGPYLDNSGGMMIAAKGEARAEIEKFAMEDPAVQSGLLTFEVKPWLIAMEKEAPLP